MLEEEYEPRRALPPHLRRLPPEEAPFSFSIRPATEVDLPYILAIYNHYVANSVVTFDEKQSSLAKLRKDFASLQRIRMPFLVAVSASGEILGYAYVHPWSDRAGSRHVVENSIYLGAAATGKGLGKALMNQLIENSKASGIRTMIAVISDKGAEASIAMHKSFGFKEVSRMGKVGFKFGRWLGSVTMEKSLKK